MTIIITLFVGGAILWLLASLSMFLKRKNGLALAGAFILLGMCMTSFAGGMMAERIRSTPHSAANQPVVKATKTP